MVEPRSGSFVPSGKYMARDGAAKRAGAQDCPNRKLCLVATDLPFLIDLLHDLSERPDCFFVKYSPEPRDGMYLGRAFLMDEREVGRLWARLKTHPKLLCSIQDDDFTLPFRPES